jgi:hypothetical protein
MKKCATELSKAFSEEDIQKAKIDMKKCSTLLAIKEMQIKTMLRLHLTPVRMATIKTTKNTNVGEDVEKKEPSYTAGRNIK